MEDSKWLIQNSSAVCGTCYFTAGGGECFLFSKQSCNCSVCGLKHAKISLSTDVCCEDAVPILSFCRNTTMNEDRHFEMLGALTYAEMLGRWDTEVQGYFSSRCLESFSWFWKSYLLIELQPHSVTQSEVIWWS